MTGRSPSPSVPKPTRSSRSSEPRPSPQRSVLPPRCTLHDPQLARVSLGSADLSCSHPPHQITRDRWIENWIHPEPIPIVHLPFVAPEESRKRKAVGGAKGKAKKAKVGKKLLKVGEEEEEDADAEAEGEGEGDEEEAEEGEMALGKNGLGSGYPSGQSCAPLSP